MRIAVIADSHLAERAPECVRNWQAAADTVAALGDVDLTIHLGDITLDGQNHPDDLPYAAGLVRDWPTPIRCVPGNHDLGDGSGEAPLDADRLARYDAAFGSDRWIVTHAGWELVGINAQLLGTGSDVEAVQQQWLAEHLAHADPATRRVLFLHRPLVRPPLASERDRVGRYVETGTAERWLRGPLARSFSLVVSGHVHQHLDFSRDGIRHLWLPSCAFVLPDSMQPVVGRKVVGLGLLDLSGSEAKFDLLLPGEMARQSLTDLACWPPR